MLEIGGAFLLGGILGILFALLTKHFKSRNNRLSVAVAMVFVTLGLCDMLGLSNLLCCMMMSAVYVNISDVYEQVFELTDRISAPIFMLFFFLSGADLNVGIIAGVGMIGVLYVIFRVVGKVLGAYLGGVICHVEPTVAKISRLYLDTSSRSSDWLGFYCHERSTGVWCYDSNNYFVWYGYL